MEILGEVNQSLDHWKAVAEEMQPKGFDPSGDERGMVVFFYRQTNPALARVDPVKSEEAGHTVYRDEPWIHIEAPGDRKNIIDRPALLHDAGPKWPSDIRRFPAAWAKFQAGDEGPVGMPLEHSGLMTNAAQVAQYRALGIKTVEQLAAVNDTALPRLGMGARELRDKAIRMTQPADERVVAVESENRLLKEQMAAMQAQIDQMVLQGQAKAAQTPMSSSTVPDYQSGVPSPDEAPVADEKPRRRGRPPKNRDA